MIRYPSEELHEEVAYIAYHFPWSYDEIMSMEHHERQRWAGEIAKINKQINSTQ